MLLLRGLKLKKRISLHSCACLQMRTGLFKSAGLLFYIYLPLGRRLRVLKFKQLAHAPSRRPKCKKLNSAFPDGEEELLQGNTPDPTEKKTLEKWVVCR